MLGPSYLPVILSSSIMYARIHRVHRVGRSFKLESFLRPTTPFFTFTIASWKKDFRFFAPASDSPHARSLCRPSEKWTRMKIRRRNLRNLRRYLYYLSFLSKDCPSTDGYLGAISIESRGRYVYFCMFKESPRDSVLFYKPTVSLDKLQYLSICY